MAVSVRRLCRNLKKEFRINLVAGAEGLSNCVDWVHIVEDYDVADFLKGQELVMTTGIGNIKTTDNLMKYVRKLYEKKCSCLIINIGPYIQEIPKILIDFCNEKKLPLFTAPWEIHLVDLTRWFCQMLIENAEKEKSLTSLVKDYLFKPEERPMLYSDLTRHGFSQHLNYCVINLGLEMDKEKIIEGKDMEKLHGYIEREINKITSNYVVFKNDNNYVLITAGIVTKDVSHFVEEMEKKQMDSQIKILMSISSNKDNLMALPENFEMSSRVYKLGRNLDIPVLYYDNLEIYKLLLLVSDKKVMKDYEKKYLGPILEYDESNDSDYWEFLKLFVEHGANVQQLANSMFVHRNTIHYKMNKIKEIAGINLSDLDDLLKVKLCLLIHNIK